MKIVQQPDQSDGFTLIVEIDDVVKPDLTYGDEFYEINLPIDPSPDDGN